MPGKATARVALIGCGGTISTLAAGPFDYVDYPETGRKLGADEALERMHGLKDLAELIPVPFRQVGSSAIGPEDWLRLVRTIARTCLDQPDLAGVVVLHGTATLEETAYFLNLTVKTDVPVVMVGAQRPLNTVGTDAVANAAAAVRVARDPQSRARGVLVVLNDEIHAARDATKGATYRLHAFHSGAVGPLGVVDPDRVVYARRPERFHTRDTPFAVDAGTSLPRVDVVYAYAGADGTVARACVAAGARGLISAGFAPGMPTPEERSALEEAARGGIAVVQSSRVGSGRIARRGYLSTQRWIAADDLTPQKARVLLMLSLTRTSDPEAIQEFFDAF